MKLFLLILEIIVATLLVGAVVLQPSEDSALGNIRSGDFLSSRSGSSLFTRITAILACLFFILCLGLSIVSNRQMDNSPIDRLDPLTKKSAQREGVPIPSDVKKNTHDIKRNKHSSVEHPS